MGRPERTNAMNYATSKIKQTTKMVLRAVCLAATLGVSLGFGADGLQLGLEVRPVQIQVYPNLLPQVSQIPASLRTVPINPNDAGAGTPVLIPFGTVEPGSYAPASSAIAPEISYGRFTLRAGGVFSWAAVAPRAIPCSPCSTGSTQEENYQGQGRTVGAALVYYSVLSRPSHVPGVLGELELRASHGLSVLVGYQASLENVVLEQGWDRYDSLQQYKTIVLSQDLAQQVYAGFRLSRGIGRSWRAGTFLLAGPARISQNPTTSGNGVLIGYNKKPFFIATGVDFHWDWHRHGPAGNGR
jgi:hypothetical protein